MLLLTRSLPVTIHQYIFQLIHLTLFPVFKNQRYSHHIFEFCHKYKYAVIRMATYEYQQINLLIFDLRKNKFHRTFHYNFSLFWKSLVRNKVSSIPYMLAAL